jgi:hypothetical protein
MNKGNSQIGLWNKGKRVHWLTEEEINSLKNNSEFRRIIEEN